MQAVTFAALGEPSRLQIVELLRAGPLPVGVIAEELGIRQPQVSKHLRVLRESGLVARDAVARQRIHRLEATPFGEIGRWAESFAQLWDTRLDSLGRYLETIDTTGKDGSR